VTDEDIGRKRDVRARDFVLAAHVCDALVLFEKLFLNFPINFTLHTF
jgi:hypothetical protein